MRFIADSYFVTWRPDNEARQSESTSQHGNSIYFKHLNQRLVFYKQVEQKMVILHVICHYVST